jgi:hypothetical protein
MAWARNKPRRQIRDDAVYVRKRQMLATCNRRHPIDYTPIVQREMNPTLKIPLRFEPMTPGLASRHRVASPA